MLRSNGQYFRDMNYGFRCLPPAVLGIFLFAVFSFAEGEFTYDPRGKRNPFIPLVTSEGRLLKLDKEASDGGIKDLLIEGIIYDKQGRSYVLVNGSVAGIGDIVNDYQILRIEEKKVIFIKEGQALEIEFNKEEE